MALQTREYSIAFESKLDDKELSTFKSWDRLMHFRVETKTGRNVMIQLYLIFSLRNKAERESASEWEKENEEGKKRFEELCLARTVN